jgi:hypothetical protein
MECNEDVCMYAVRTVIRIKIRINLLLLVIGTRLVRTLRTETRK